MTTPAVAPAAKLIRTAPGMDVGAGADVGGTAVGGIAVGGSEVGGTTVAVGTIIGVSVDADVGKADVGAGVLSTPQARTVKVVTVKTTKILNFVSFFMFPSLNKQSIDWLCLIRMLTLIGLHQFERTCVPAEVVPCPGASTI